ncbi:MAG: DoxX family protein [bacterium]|nr:DoxX family protein [bacterium]
MLKTALLWVMGPLYVLAGVMHFVRPDLYLQIMPPYLPAHLLLVLLSGVAEIVLGILVLVPRTRVLAAWGLIALLVAVFPANVYMATANPQLVHLPSWLPAPSPTANWVRLPFQLVFIAWAWWYTRPDPR